VLAAVVRAVVVAAAVLGTTPAASAQLALSVPTTLSGHPGDTITVPVNLTVVGNQLSAANGNGIGAFSVALSYNPTLTTTVGPIDLGSLLSTPSYGFSGYTTNNTAGLVRAVTSSTQGTLALPAGTQGSLALVPFTLSLTVAPGTYPIDFLATSGPTTTSIVDNTFTTYTLGAGLTFTSGSVTVAPVPEPGGPLLAAAAAGAAWALRRKRAGVRPGMAGATTLIR
jgi:MYXO-CTERM domain-containing protein